jgi:2-phospho-L-lactate transferase/gluconeogenesis factor (CofD/UPF0052 family)
MESDEKIRVVLFSGGRGASSIATALTEHEQIRLTVLVNAYDDGLSTGLLRRFIPGMLGPSDIRKNVRTLMPETEQRHRALKELLDYRFADEVGREEAMRSLQPIAAASGDLENAVLADLYRDLTIGQASVLADWCRAFLDYEEERLQKDVHFTYGDTAVGNILFGGCYLEAERDFNRAIEVYAGFCEVRSPVLDITDGVNFVLTAIKSDGTFLPDEAAIVSPQEETSPIEELFLLEDYLSEEDLSHIADLSREERLDFLRQLQRTPCPNPEALREIEAADLIIYGPGTQHSSLFPSYLTDGVTEGIVANDKAEKIFVANIRHDHDIRNQTVRSLLQSFLFNMRRKGKVATDIPQLITSLFVQDPDRSDMNREEADDYVPFESGSVDLQPQVVKALDWEEKIGVHSGGQIVDEMLGIVQRLVDVKVQPFRHKISIVIPALNEANTVQKVLRKVGQIDFGRFGVSKEIIFVDGGSTDGTLELAMDEKYVRVYALEGKKGRGEALKFGLSKARGNVVVFFPADDEYEAEDIISVVEPIVRNQFNVVIGSRAIKCISLDQRIRHIYSNQRLSFLLSKYGGMLLSIVSLLLYSRYVTDPFSILKGFDSSLLKSLELESSGVDLETEIIAKVSKKQEFILEVPVQYQPRRRSEGKKTTVLQGLKALKALLAWRFRS